jgi:hypothetical protein
MEDPYPTIFSVRQNRETHFETLRATGNMPFTADDLERTAHLYKPDFHAYCSEREWYGFIPDPWNMLRGTFMRQLELRCNEHVADIAEAVIAASARNQGQSREAPVIAQRINEAIEGLGMVFFSEEPTFPSQVREACQAQPGPYPLGLSFRVRCAAYAAPGSEEYPVLLASAVTAIKGQGSDSGFRIIEDATITVVWGVTIPGAQIPNDDRSRTVSSEPIDQLEFSQLNSAAQQSNVIDWESLLNLDTLTLEEADVENTGSVSSGATT